MAKPKLSPRALAQWQAERLELAQEILEGVVSTLDGSRHRCEACGIDVLRNKSDGRRLDTLVGIHERLGRLAGSFRHDAEEPSS